jgi:signal transduction histidine kinase
MRSLFAKIYVTLIASLALVAIASGIFFHFTRNYEESGWHGRRQAFAEAMLPPGDDRLSTQSMLDRLGEAFNADLVLYGPDGEIIAATDARMPTEGERRSPWRQRTALVIELSGGRRLIAARFDGPPGPPGRNPLALLALIAGVVALAAYPVVRHLTRRLELLRAGVESWGQGTLSQRVPDQGRDEVAAVARSFNQAADRIERLVAAHRALLANASHELRSPLARLRMAIDLYETAPDTSRKAEIVQNLAELDGIVEEILLASRLDHIDRLERNEAIDLLAIAAEEGARLGIAVAGSSAVVRGDAHLLARLVRNLMHNALRHGAPPVTAHVEQRGGEVVLAVRDHGPGIPLGEAERVFEPFYRPAGRSETAGGWGLGLSLARQIAERHGGSVRHEAPPDGGACFVVTLPAQPAGTVS